MPAPRICVFAALTYVPNPANPGKGKPWARVLAQNLLAAYWGSAALVQWYFAHYQMWPGADLAAGRDRLVSGPSGGPQIGFGASVLLLGGAGSEQRAASMPYGN